jgi:hypothetical protein
MSDAELNSEIDRLEAEILALDVLIQETEKLKDKVVGHLISLRQRKRRLKHKLNAQFPYDALPIPRRNP